MNLQLKKSKRGKRVVLDDTTDPDNKRVCKVTTLEPESIVKETRPIITLDSDPEPDSEAKEWYKQVEELPDEPDDNVYKELSVAEFGAALRRGIGIPETSPSATEESALGSHDYSGIGYKKI